MNAFMMYKSAYSERAKAFLKIKNFQIVNRVIAASWNIEIDEVKQFYKSMSQIEHDNHQRTHPSYKFRPKKCPVVATRADPMTPSPSPSNGAIMDYASPSGSTWSNLDFSAESQYHHGQSQSLEFGDLHISRSNTTTPFQHQSMAANGYMNSSWTGFPSSTPTVQPSALHGSMASQVEDVRHFNRSTPMPEELQYGVPSGLNGIPGEPHHDLMQPQQVHPSGVDPQMLGYDESINMSMGMTPTFGAMPNSYPVWDDVPSTHSFLTAPPPSGTSTPVPYHNAMAAASFPSTMQRNPSWDPSQHGSNELDETWIEL